VKLKISAQISQRATERIEMGWLVRFHTILPRIRHANLPNQMENHPQVDGAFPSFCVAAEGKLGAPKEWHIQFDPGDI